MVISSTEEIASGHADALLGLFEPGGRARVLAMVVLRPADQSLDYVVDGVATPAQTAWGYAAGYPDCRWLILSNQRELRLYSRARMPDSFEAFWLPDLADLAAFGRFYVVLARENLLPQKEGALSLTDGLLSASSKADMGVAVALQKECRELREALYAELCGSPSRPFPPPEPLRMAQTLLDRVLFIAFSESRRLLPQGLLQHAATVRDKDRPKPLWHNFRALFRTVDQGNPDQGVPALRSGFFRDDAYLKAAMISDSLSGALAGLARYDFRDQVSMHGLSHVFEQSMADLDGLRGDPRPAVPEPKRMKHRSEGAFYTPWYMARFIVDQTLGRVFKDKWEAALRQHPSALEQDHAGQNHAWLAVWETYQQALQETRVLDPACGAGAFLIAAFESFEYEYARVSSAIADLRGGQERPFDSATTILQKNLFGMGMNAQSVDITKLVLWLLGARKDAPLPNLDGNIKRGNAIIADSMVDPYAFNWQTGTLDREYLPDSSRAAAMAARWSEGFDVVIGNPPYMRQELLAAYKPHLQASYPKTHHRSADMFVYFFERGISLLKRGGRLGFVVTNKWLRSRNAALLRRLFAEETRAELLVDFGHATFVPGTDVFPCLITLAKPDGIPAVPRDHAIQVSFYPKTEIDRTSIHRYVERHSHSVRQATLGQNAWSLLPPEEDTLIQKIQSMGVPLAELAKAKPYYGIKTGLNEAFLIDTPTRDRLVKQDPRSAEILKKYVRGQDIARWIPEWDGLWMIFARRGIQIEAYPAIREHLKHYRAALEPLPAKQHADGQQGRKAGNYQWYELQDTVDYWEIFEKPKIVYQEIQFHPAYAFDKDRIYANNKCFILPCDDPWILAVLNSPLMWWHNWRYLPHMKDDALTPLGIRMEKLPIAPAPNEARDIAEACVPRLVTIAGQNRQIQREVLQTLHGQFGIPRLGAKLVAFSHLDSSAFIAEVTARRSGPEAALRPSEVGLLQKLHTDASTVIEKHRREAAKLERRISAAVNDAYGLTPEDVEFLWKTAPPRMPAGKP
jgi:hypothetical protein